MGWDGGRDGEGGINKQREEWEGWWRRIQERWWERATERERGSDGKSAESVTLGDTEGGRR